MWDMRLGVCGGRCPAKAVASGYEPVHRAEVLRPATADRRLAVRSERGGLAGRGRVQGGGAFNNWRDPLRSSGLIDYPVHGRVVALPVPFSGASE